MSLNSKNIIVLCILCVLMFDSVIKSAFSQAVTLIPDIPSKPVVTQINDTNNLKINWTGNGFTYNLQYRINAGEWTTAGHVLSTTSIYAGQIGSSYQFRVAACADDGNIIILPPDPIPPYSLFSMSSSVQSEVCSSWSAASNSITVLADQVTTPTISPDGGTFTGSVNISLSTATSGATLRYSTNNTAVTASSQVYTAPFTLTSSTTVRVKAFKNGMESVERSAGFIIHSGENSPIEPILVTPPLSSGTIDTMNKIAGQFDVTPAGQATYSVQILSAKGTAGLQPEFRLNYSSGAGNGLLGLGWSLTGTGAITRCRQTYASERNALPIKWSSDDRFCLNGQRLLVVSGSYGEVGSTYKIAEGSPQIYNTYYQLFANLISAQSH